MSAGVQGLREFPSSVIVPMMQISWTMFSILSGGIYFHEYRVFTLLSGSMFALGVVVCPSCSARFCDVQFAEAILQRPACICCIGARWPAIKPY